MAQEIKKKHPGGRPSKYPGISLKKVTELAELGLTEKQMAYVLGITEETINQYKKRPEFSEALRKGKQISDGEVVRSLFERATGYSHPETKVFCSEGSIIKEDVTRFYPPDPTSMIFWLKNRLPKEWKDKVVHAGDEDEPLGVILYPEKKKPGAE